MPTARRIRGAVRVRAAAAEFAALVSVLSSAGATQPRPYHPSPGAARIVLAMRDAPRLWSATARRSAAASSFAKAFRWRRWGASPSRGS
jgi:hypothetical protein